MKKLRNILLSSMVLILGLVLVACKPRYEPIINVDDFDKNWTFDSKIDTKITFAHTMGKTENPSEGQQALLDVQIAAFKKEMQEKYQWNVDVVHSPYGGYDDLLDKISKDLPQGNEPNLAYAYPDHVASYIASDKVLPLDNLINNKDSRIALSKDELSDYVDSFMDEGRFYDHNKTTLSVPFSKSTEVLFYNKTYFEKNKLEVPKTWDDVIKVGEKIQAIEGKDSDIKPFAYDSDDNLFIVRTAQIGGKYTELDENLKGQAVFDTAQNKAMIKELKDMYDKGLITTKGMIGGYSSDQFKLQKVIMTVGSTGGTRHNVPANGEFEVGVAPMPQENVKNPKTILQGPSIVIFRKGIRPAIKDEEGNVQWAQPQPSQAEKNEMIASWMFYKFITRPENTIKQAMGTGYLPVRKSAFETEEYINYQNASGNASAADKARADVLKLAEQLMKDDAFFVSPAYPTSSKARKAVGVLIMDVFASKADNLDRLFKKAIASSS